MHVKTQKKHFCISHQKSQQADTGSQHRQNDCDPIYNVLHKYLPAIITTYYNNKFYLPEKNI